MEYVAVATIIASGVYQANEQKRAGQFQEIQHKEQAEEEVDAARDREVERRRRLVQALAIQNAEGGAMGAAPGFGSRGAIALSDVRRANLDSLSDRSRTNRRALRLREAGRFARKQGDAAAVGTLLETAGQVAGGTGGGG